jgi:hypothetical protein
MNETLTIAISETTMARLRQQSAEQGKTPETLAAEYLDRAVPSAGGAFLKRWTGALASNVADAGVNHDAYLGQALYEQIEEPRHD